MALSWGVKTGSSFSLQFFMLISDSLGGVIFIYASLCYENLMKHPKMKLLHHNLFEPIMILIVLYSTSSTCCKTILRCLQLENAIDFFLFLSLFSEIIYVLYLFLYFIVYSCICFFMLEWRIFTKTRPGMRFFFLFLSAGHHFSFEVRWWMDHLR